jgi:hypothetical protein
MQMSPGDLSLSANTSSSRSHWLHATLKGVVALAPAGQSELCAVLADFFPYKLMPAAVQQQYVSQLLTVCQYLPHFQPKILELIISKCLEIDVDIVIEEGGVAEFLEGQGKEEEEEEEDPSGLLFDLDDEDEEDQPGHSSSSITELHFLNGGADAAHSKRRVVRSLWATSSSGVFEAYCGGSSSSFSHRIGADVAEMADKLDAMLALLMNYISTQFAANEATRERLFFQLLGTFEKIVLTVHRAKFVQFIMFYMCAKHQPYAVLFARRLLEIFADPQQSASGSAVRRQSAVMYLASFLSRLAALPPAIIRYVGNLRTSCSARSKFISLRYIYTERFYLRYFCGAMHIQLKRLVSRPLVAMRRRWRSFRRREVRDSNRMRSSVCSCATRMATPICATRRSTSRYRRYVTCCVFMAGTSGFRFLLRIHWALCVFGGCSCLRCSLSDSAPPPSALSSSASWAGARAFLQLHVVARDAL